MDDCEMMLTFDPATHQYRIDGRPVPNVTQVLSELLPSWRASEWHLQRGSAIHACAAMIAKGQIFEYDPQIDGQVKACRKWFHDFRPVVNMVETQVCSVKYQFAGTIDLLVDDGTMVEWKSSPTAIAPMQMAGYSLAFAEAGIKIEKGICVALGENGQYRCSEVYKLARWRQRWLALLTVYGIRKQLKIEEKGDERED
jgi:hypothetical protein